MQKSKVKNISKKFKVPASQVGQSLITLLFFMVIGITVISSAALIVAADILSASNSENGLTAYYAAESGVEDGILYLLSHPNPSSPVTLNIPVGSGKASITIQSNGTITSKGTSGTTVRTVQAQATYADGSYSVSGWKEQ